LSKLKLKTRVPVVSRNTVKVEDLDRAILRILGAKEFLSIDSRRERHARAVETIAEKALPESRETLMIYQAAKELMDFGAYEQPPTGFDLFLDGAKFTFEERTIDGQFQFRCTKPGGKWQKRDKAYVDRMGRSLMA
jgi:hypothetical protein